MTAISSSICKYIDRTMIFKIFNFILVLIFLRNVLDRLLGNIGSQDNMNLQNHFSLELKYLLINLK